VTRRGRPEGAALHGGLAGVNEVHEAGVGVGAGGNGYGLEGANQVLGLAFVEEAEEALEVFVVESVVDIFFKVEAELGFGEVHLEGGFSADFGELTQAEIAGGEKVCG